MFERYHVMPLLIGLTPTTGLALPGTVPLVQRQEALAGVLRWRISDWNEAEFARVAEAVNNMTQKSLGKKLEEYIMILAEAVAKAIPGREFHLEVSSFGVDYKPERRKK